MMMLFNVLSISCLCDHQMDHQMIINHQTCHHQIDCVIKESAFDDGLMIVMMTG